MGTGDIVRELAPAAEIVNKSDPERELIGNLSGIMGAHRKLITNHPREAYALVAVGNFIYRYDYATNRVTLILTSVNGGFKAIQFAGNGFCYAVHQFTASMIVVNGYVAYENIIPGVVPAGAGRFYDIACSGNQTFGICVVVGTQGTFRTFEYSGTTGATVVGVPVGINFFTVNVIHNGFFAGNDGWIDVVIGSDSGGVGSKSYVHEVRATLGGGGPWVSTCTITSSYEIDQSGGPTGVDYLPNQNVLGVVFSQGNPSMYVINRTTKQVQVGNPILPAYASASSYGIVADQSENRFIYIFNGQLTFVDIDRKNTPVVTLTGLLSGTINTPQSSLCLNEQSRVVLVISSGGGAAIPMFERFFLIRAMRMYGVIQTTPLYDPITGELVGGPLPVYGRQRDFELMDTDLHDWAGPPPITNMSHVWDIRGIDKKLIFIKNTLNSAISVVVQYSIDSTFAKKFDRPAVIVPALIGQHIDTLGDPWKYARIVATSVNAINAGDFTVDGTGQE